MSLQIRDVERNYHAVGDDLEFARSCKDERCMRVLVLEYGREVEINLIVGWEVRDKLVDLPLEFHGFLKCKIVNLKVKWVAIGAPLQVFYQLREPSDRQRVRSIRSMCGTQRKHGDSPALQPKVGIVRLARARGARNSGRRGAELTFVHVKR